MGKPSFEAANAVVYVTYGAFLLLGTGLAWRMKNQPKADFLAGNRRVRINHYWDQEEIETTTVSQKCQLLMVPILIMSNADIYIAFPLALNFIAAGLFPLCPKAPGLDLEGKTAAHYGRGSDKVLGRDPTSHASFLSKKEGSAWEEIRETVEEKLRLYPMGSGILFTYPELATLAGLQGVVVYALSSALPLLVFAALGPIIRRKCPEGFVLTEWTRQRYGHITALYLSLMTLLTLFLYMVSELSAVGQVVTALAGLDGLPIVIVECVVTTVYTSLGGFRISFLTDNIQGAMIICLVIIATITIGAKTEIKRELVENSGLLDANLLGWQLLYIFPIAILTNDFFLSNYWLRTFASKTDKDLWVGISAAMVVILIVLTMVGCTGLIAAWTGAWDINQDGSVAFFLLLEQLPNWVVGIVLVMAIALSTAAFDSLQSAMVSSASNDLFRNKLSIWWIRGGVVLIIIPVVVLALKAPSILQIYLITDLLSAATIPVLILGLSEYFYFWRGFEVLVGGLGGILTVFIFGTIYYGNAQAGGKLILLEQGLYGDDWGAFGAFVAAPVGGLLWGFGALALRLGVQFIRAKLNGGRFDALDRPFVVAPQGDHDDYVAVRINVEAHREAGIAKATGNFF